ncbi:MFS transporter [Saccharibacillus kuerlensis]|uniref:MFS transporter n=1 Tax=Saccharibacillus kuerlensis TaxID=459527 RepID=A0ABQ2KZX5_9BACL|nr:MFS transporter [Saccharibacillus kuerlensis]GGN98239.1 MFS transporter [Saccharibacillus kuerlensis]
MKSVIWPGMAMVAVCYAFARFAFALFLPEIAREFNLNSAETGRIQSLSYLAYTLALLASSFTLRTIGQRYTILLTGICAITGLTIIALSSGIYSLAGGLFLAGLSTGWVSPVLGQLVVRLTVVDRQNGANAWINSGSGVGIVLSGLTAVILGTSWRSAYGLFAAAGCLVLIWMFYRLRGTSNDFPQGNHLWKEARKSGRLLPASLLAGLGCSVYWTYLISHLQSEQQLSASQASLYWIAVGGAGIVGGMASQIAGLLGIRRAYAIAVLSLSASVALIAMSVPSVSLISSLLFGTGYVFITGLFILWGTGIQGSSPSAQISLSFFALGVGQFAGSWLAGTWIENLGYNPAFLLFALILLGGLLFCPTTIKPGSSA